MRANTLATGARNAYRERPYYGGRPEPGFMSGGFAITRDSDPLEQSNYRMAAQAYRAEGIEIQCDSFNHWAVGWVEYLTVPINATAVRVAQTLADRIENYPILDDEDFSQAEWDDDHPSDGRCYSRWERDNGEPCPCGLPRS